MGRSGTAARVNICNGHVARAHRAKRQVNIATTFTRCGNSVGGIGSVTTLGHHTAQRNTAAAAWGIAATTLVGSNRDVTPLGRHSSPARHVTTSQQGNGTRWGVGPRQVFCKAGQV